MSFLLDTSVLSQPLKPVPDAAFMRWWKAQPVSELWLSSISVFELRYGFELLPQGKRRRDLEVWLESTIPKLSHRIIPVDDKIADLAGKMMASAKMSGHSAEASDVLIAAPAIVHGLTLATLNRKHFERIGVTLVDF